MRKIIIILAVLIMAPISWHFGGDQEKAKGHAGIALNRLTVLKQKMSLNKLKQGFSDWYRQMDGSVFRVSSVYGMDKIEIFSPFHPETAIETPKLTDKFAIVLFSLYQLSSWPGTNEATFTGIYKDGKWSKLGVDGTIFPNLYAQNYSGYDLAAGWNNNDISVGLHKSGLVVTAVPGWQGTSGMALVQVSTDFGKSWGSVIPLGSLVGAEMWTDVEINAQGEIFILVGDVNAYNENGYRIYKSVDKGASFNLLSTQANIVDEYSYNVNLAVNGNDWAFPVTGGEVNINRSGSYTMYETWEGYQGYPQIGMSSTGTMCWVDSSGGHTAIFRNGVKVWDAPTGGLFAYFGIPSDIRADGNLWVASMMNMDSTGAYGSTGDTWGILVSEDDGITWTVKPVSGSTIINNSATFGTFGGKASIDVSGKRIVVSITQMDKVQVFLSEAKGDSFKKILDETAPAGRIFGNFMLSPVRIVTLGEE